MGDSLDLMAAEMWTSFGYNQTASSVELLFATLARGLILALLTSSVDP